MGTAALDSWIALRQAVNSVPPLKRRITSQRTAVGSRLKEVPEPLSRDPQFELLDLCNTLFIRLNNQYLGLPGREQLWRQTRKVYKDFKDEVEQAVPVFEVTTVTEDAPGHGPHTPSQATPADDPGGDLRGRRNITLHEVRVLIEKCVLDSVLHFTLKLIMLTEAHAQTNYR